MRIPSSVLFTGLTLLLAGAAGPHPVAAASGGDTVLLPNGDHVAIGMEGGTLVGAHDDDRLEAVLWHLIDAGRVDDAVVALAYVARHRPAAATQLAVMGLRIASDLGDIERAKLITAAVIRETGAAPEAIAAALRRAGLPIEAVPGVALAASTQPGEDPTAADQPEDGRARSVPNRGGDAAPGDSSDSRQSYGAHGGERRSGSFGSGLPAGLIIGGGNAGSSPPGEITDPPVDGGVSG